MPSLYEYAMCAESGLTQSETADKLGVSREAVSQAAKRHKISFVKHPQRGKPFGGFESQTAAAKAFGVTPQAIWNSIRRGSA